MAPERLAQGGVALAANFFSKLEASSLRHCVRYGIGRAGFFKTLSLPATASRPAAALALGRGIASARDFGDAAKEISITPRQFNFRYRSAARFIDDSRTWYGPMHKAFGALPEDQGAALQADLTDLIGAPQPRRQCSVADTQRLP